MEVELEPRVNPLPFKVKGMSRESPSQKGAYILDTDLRTHWSTGTNTKEWILLELDEPCLLSHIRIYNKSVLEWEISVGLRYKLETFVKVRPRCEAPRRDMMYPMNYTSCRYVRISCLRGNPIAIFFIQLIGVTVTGLEPEFQPVVTYMLPHIISHKLDAHDMHLQLLQDMTNRLTVFIPQLEAELNSFSDAAEPSTSIRFLAMLVGPLYPILRIVNERETARLAGSSSDSETSKSSHSSSALLVSSNFEPRRSRTASPILLPTSSSLVFRPDAILVLLRKAYKDPNLGTVCRMASRILLKFVEPIAVQKASIPSDATTFVFDEASISEPASPVRVVDYSNLFGEEFQIPEDHWDSNYLNVLDIRAVEEGVLHVLYACASQPLFCSKLADSTSDFWAALPLVQALLPALRPNVCSPDQVDDNFTQWKQPFVQHALSQIVATSSSAVYHPLLRGCAGYLSSFSPSHAKAACVLIDLCSGVLAPWMAQVIAKVDLTLELLEDLLGVIQGTRHSLTRARAALKYIVLALSGHMDDIMARYKEVKHRILFLVEMLEPFLDPAITPLKSMIAFGNVSVIYLEKQENTCAIALNVIRTAVRKSAVLPSLESEWRRGSVAPSVLLSILEPHMQLPPDIDLRKFSVSEPLEPQASSAPPLSSGLSHGGVSAKFNSQDDTDGKADVSDTSKIDIFEDVSLVFAPPELRSTALTNFCGSPDKRSLDLSRSNVGTEEKHVIEKNVNHQFHNSIGLDTGYAIEHSDLHADYLQLMSYRDSELWASEFRRLAFDLHSQTESNPESHSAAIDALLLAAECYVNPFFLMSFKQSAKVNQTQDNCRISGTYEFADLRRVLEESHNNLETVSHLERKRDTIVLQILLEAAKSDRDYGRTLSDGEPCSSGAEGNEEVINLSEHDNLYVDAITLVRQNQELLCNFLIQCLLREKNSMHEVLMQSLVFLLHSATKLYCTPEDVIDIILESAESFNGLLMSFYYQFKEGNLQLDPVKVHEVQRRWVLLQRLVIASSGDEEGLDKSISMNNGFQFANLIPPSAWIQRIPTFSSSSSPLVRFLGWMAVSRNAKVYQKERLFLASDLSQLMYLLSIFSDELAVVDNIVNQKDENMNIEQQGLKEHTGTDEGFKLPVQQYEDQSFRVMHPDISRFFPYMRNHFESFGDIILEAVGLQLRSLSSSVVPDLLCWFSDLCSWPFLQKDKDRLSSTHSSDTFKGFVGKNARVIILYVLEAIVIEHMEAMVPEVPRVVQVLVSLCQTSYCDVAFLDSILRLLNPIIAYSLHKVSDEEKLLIDDSCLNFESLCFDELFCNIRSNNVNQKNPAKSEFSRSLTIFILGSVFLDLTFNRKREILRSLIFWADFAAFEPMTSFHDYICAFQTIMKNCKLLLVETLRIWGVIPLKMPMHSDTSICAPSDDSSESHSWFLNDFCNNSNFPTAVREKVESNYDDAGIMDRRVCHLSVEEAISFSEDLEGLISKLNPTIELCWKLHYQLAKNLTLTSTQCFMYSRCLSSIAENVSISAGVEKENVLLSDLADNFPVHWRISLEGLAEMIVVLLETRCWEVASTMLDCVLGMPLCFCLDNVIGSICSAIKTFSCSAPKIAWRLQTDKWLSSLLARDIHSHHESEIPLVDLLSAMLGHPEPEQRFIALNHLGKLVCRDVDDGSALLPSTTYTKLTLPELVVSSCHAISSPLVSSTWDRVVGVASSDKSLPLRTRAIALLVSYVPFAERHRLQSLLTAADHVLHGLTNLAHPTCEGPLIQISLALIASVCLYSPAEDISLIPQNVWTNIETLGKLETERRSGDLEKKACQALCRLKDEGDDAKEILKEVFSSSSPRQIDPDFGSTRDSILQVLANLTSVQSYFNFFSKRTEEKDMELEEAEMEMDLIQKEVNEFGLQESTKYSKDSHQHPILPTNANDDNRLQQIRDGIRSLEKSKLKEEIIARRQKKLLVRRARQKYLEEAAVQEAELLQQLDRERTTEAEREIERQRLLELERAKTSELRHNLDMEKEKQTQRELQRELEQAESGHRPSRREYPSSTHSRPRERYGERENGRSGNEGSLRSSSGSLQPESGMPTVVLSGSRQFSGQPPTILQSRDRQDEGGSSHEENFDGSRDSGDTGSVGDPDLVSALEGQPGGFGSSQRHGSRGSKSRQIVERRERDRRREGKWERKH